MNHLSLTRSFGFKLALCLGIAGLLMFTQTVHAQNLRVEAKLVWGTDDSQSPNPKHHPLDAALTHRLKMSPYRWKHYFEECRQVVDIPVGQTRTKIVMSDRCFLDIKNLGNDRVEVHLHGNGKPVSVHRESLKGNGLLVIGGKAANETAWLVTIRKASPPSSVAKPAAK